MSKRELKTLEFMTEPELQKLMQALGDAIGATCAKAEVEPPMFALVLFNDPKVGQYVANCERADVVQALRELAARLERKSELPRVPFTS